jgi:hypothetical protein
VTADSFESDGPGAPALGAPAEIMELSEACRQYVLSSLGVELDYTPETLSVVDHYVAQARENLADRPELLELVTRSAGAYFGEVVRRALGGFWRLPTGDAHDWQLCMETVFLAINPVAVAWDALHESADHSGPSSQMVLDRDDQESVEQRLAAMPPLPEDQLWMLTTRLEVLEATIEHLRHLAERAGISEVTYEADDYDIAPRALGQA